MDGVHDLGGRQGFGPVVVEPYERHYHARWEAATRLLFRVILPDTCRMAATARSVTRSNAWTRCATSTSSYYERWVTAAATLAVESGIVTHAELEERAGGPYPLSGPVTAETITDPPAGRARFTVGDRVRVRGWHPRGHTRCPWYIRGHVGVVTRCDGSFSLPDVEAHSRASCTRSHLLRALRRRRAVERRTARRNRQRRSLGQLPGAGMTRSATITATTRRRRRPIERRAAALEELLTEKGLVPEGFIEEVIRLYENDIGPHERRQGRRPRMGRLLSTRPGCSRTARLPSPSSASARPEGNLVAVENTPGLHNVVVCTLCSCYPWSILGLPPAWYKDAPYRARMVREPRVLLQEMGCDLSDDVDIRVWDSSAEVRYLVVPERPAGTDGLSEEELAALVTRDSMIGVARL